MSLKKIYETKYKKLLLIPIILVVLAFIQIGVQFSTTGDFVNRGISLKGGSTITIDYDPSINIDELESHLATTFARADIIVRTLSSAGQVTKIAVDSDAQDDTEIQALIASINQLIPLQQGEYSVEVVGSSLGKSFFQQTAIALIVAFLLMGVVVLIYFRKVVPAFTVMASAFFDILITLAIFNLTGIKLSSAGIAAFLMIIGYSVDTDILLNTRLVKRTEGTEPERIYSAMKTGLTMTATTLTAVLVSIIFVQSEIVKQIMIILFIGLLVDTLMTYVFNVGILRMYLERQRK
jgi:preprotein translocase subunit SecF